MDKLENIDRSSKGATAHHRGNKKQWKDLSSKRRARIVAQVAIQLTLSAVALWDLRHRPAEQVKGSKRLWTLLTFVQPIGPIAYLLFGRKK